VRVYQFRHTGIDRFYIFGLSARLSHDGPADAQLSSAYPLKNAAFAAPAVTPPAQAALKD
jgi:hypothetical protein